MLRAPSAIVALLLGCSSAPRRSLPSHSTLDEPRPPRVSGPKPSVPTPATAAASAAPASSRLVGFSFARVETSSIVSLAVGKPPKIALLAAGEALIGDGRAPFVRAPVPETRDSALAVEIFFGRDDQPRLMGMRHGASGKSEPYYRRYKGGRFQPEPSELGPLAGGGGALYGVLGHADPEVVCKPGASCLVKRTTGWGHAPAHAEPVRVVLGGGTAWALHRDRIERLEGEQWVPLVPVRAFEEPLSLFVDGDGAPWIVEGRRDGVTRLAGGRWETLSTPVRAPRAIAGSGSSDVWLVGASGAAHFDGRAWAVVSDVIGPLSLVALAPPNVWLAGEAGAFRGTAAPP